MLLVQLFRNAFGFGWLLLAGAVGDVYSGITSFFLPNILSIDFWPGAEADISRLKALLTLKSHAKL